MMNLEPEDRGSGIDEGTPADAGTRLQSDREILRQRLAQERNEGLRPMDGIARMAPLARQFVREHPYASLSGAALAGAWLARRKPWRSVGGSLLAGVLTRQALALSLSSGSQLLKGMLTAAARSRPASDRKP